MTWIGKRISSWFVRVAHRFSGAFEVFWKRGFSR